MALATFFFSSMEVALNGMVGHVSAAQVNCTRFGIGGLFLLPLAIREMRRRAQVLSASMVLQLFLLGFLGMVVSMSMYQLSVESIPANVVAVLFCTNTVFVLLFAAIILRTPISRLEIASVVVAMLGIGILVDPLHTNLPLQGLILGLAAPLFFALYAIFGSRIAVQIGGISLTCLTFLTGCLLTLLLIGLGNCEIGSRLLERMGLHFLCGVDLVGGYTLETVWRMLYVSVGVSGLGFACYFLSQEFGSPLLASLAFYLKPIFAPIFCWLILGEKIVFTTKIGIVFLLVGSAMALFARIADGRKKA